jgi:hypothetical protein
MRKRSARWSLTLICGRIISSRLQRMVMIIGSLRATNFIAVRKQRA